MDPAEYDRQKDQAEKVDLYALLRLAATSSDWHTIVRTIGLHRGLNALDTAQLAQLVYSTGGHSSAGDAIITLTPKGREVLATMQATTVAH